MKSYYASVFGALCLATSIRAQEHIQPESFDLLPRQATASTPRPALGSVPYGVAIMNCAVPGAVALTYDDGPGIYTSELLDLLLANSIHATFFILGNRNGSGPIDQVYPDLIKRMYREGHQIASHTWDHQSLESLTTSQRVAEMTKTEAAFTNILGFFPTYMRPPYGFCYGPSGCLSDMGNLGYHVIDWSVDTKDYENDSPTLIVNAENNWDAAFQPANPTTASFIPLTHDIHQNTVEILAPYMIKEIKQKGYKFLTVGECLNDPSQNWYRNATTGQTVGYKAVSQSTTNSGSLSATAATSSVSSGSSRVPSSSSAVNASTTHTSSSIKSSQSTSTHSSTSSASASSTSTHSASSSSKQLTVTPLLCIVFMLFSMLLNR